jgi:uncharacterized FlaG/YvyC family protein
MSDTRDLRIEPTAPSQPADSVQAARLERAAQDVAAQKQPAKPVDSEPVAAVGGSMHSAYAQYVIDPDTHDIIVRIRDTATDAVLSELPSPEVQALSRHLHEYTQALARRRIVLQSSNGL